MSALEHYAAPSHVAPSGGFATGDASEDKGKENRDRYHWNEWDLTANGGWLKDWQDLGVPSCRGAFTSFKRVASRNDGSGWFLFRF